MAISVLGTPATAVVEGDNYTPESGSNRIVVTLTASHHDTVESNPGANTFNGGDYDSVAMALDANTGRYSSGSGRTWASAIMRAAEADLPAGAAALGLSWDVYDPPDDHIAAMLTLGDVDQTTPVVDSDAQSNSTTATVTVVDGGIVVASMIERDVMPAEPAGYTTISTYTGDFYYRCCYKLITADGSETPDFTTSGLSPSQRVTEAVSYRPAAGGPAAYTESPSATAIASVAFARAVTRYRTHGHAAAGGLSLGKGAGFSRTHGYSAAGSTTLQTGSRYLLTASPAVAGTASFARVAARLRTFAASASASLSRQRKLGVGKATTATGTPSSAQDSGMSYGGTFTATGTAGSALGTTFKKTLASTANAAASLRKRIGKSLQHFGRAAASLIGDGIVATAGRTLLRLLTRSLERDIERDL